MKLGLVEPLRSLFKDEVRSVGWNSVYRMKCFTDIPFPGPVLASGFWEKLHEEKVRLLQDADAIYINGFKKHNLYATVWQAGTIRYR